MTVYFSMKKGMLYTYLVFAIFFWHKRNLHNRYSPYIGEWGVFICKNLGQGVSMTVIRILILIFISVFVGNVVVMIFNTYKYKYMDY
jgi:hypothetical protein